MTTYNKSGVNIKRADGFVNRIRPYAKSTHKYLEGKIVSEIGGYASVYIPKRPWQSVGDSTDGVGSKICMSAHLDCLNTIGIDLLAMCANDLFVTMEPDEVLFQDYLAVGKLNLNSGERIIAGIARGCHLVGAALMGGETAEMPIVYSQHEFDLSGTIVGGAYSKESYMTPEFDIRPGMGVFGFRSSGVHANGFTLIHDAFDINYERPNDATKKLHAYLEEYEQTLGDVLLTPTTIYTDKVSRLRKKYRIAGFAHVTGGGMVRNIPRILPPNCDATLKVGSWKQQPIFEVIAKAGNVNRYEMLNTFNLGIGLVAVTNDDLTSEDWYHIGDVVKGEGKLKVNWPS